MRNKNQIGLFLGLVFLLSCGSCETDQNIAFNGFKDLNATYKIHITISEGKGSQIIVSNKTSTEFETEWHITSLDSIQYESTISRLQYKYGKNSFFKYVFDTDLDTVTVVSDYMDVALKDSEKRIANDALTALKQIKGKSVLTTLDNKGTVQLKKNEILTKDYVLDSYYNPEELMLQIFKPSEVLTLFDAVFYPELGSYTKGKQYEVKKANDSLTFTYTKTKSTKDILYSEQRLGTNEYRSVESRIDSKTGNLLESKFTERIKKDGDIIGIYTIVEREVVVQKIN